MRKHGKSDGNQALIVKALRQAGVSVQTLQSVGDGCPDLLCGYNYENILLEVKDPSQKPSDQRLTEDQVYWHKMWLGQVAVVRTPEEAISVCRRTKA